MDCEKRREFFIKYYKKIPSAITVGTLEAAYSITKDELKNHPELIKFKRGQSKLLRLLITYES